MAVRKNDFMPSWLQSPNADGQKAWKAGSGRDALYSPAADNHAPPHMPPLHDMRLMPAYPIHNDNIGGRKSQRALSFDTPDHSHHARPRNLGYRRSPGNGGGGAGGGDVFNRLPRGQRSSDPSMWPRPEALNTPSQGLERNFHQHFPSLRGTSAGVDHSSFNPNPNPNPHPHPNPNPNPSGAWDRHSVGTVRSHYTHSTAHGFNHRRLASHRSSHSLDSSPTDEEAAARNRPSAVGKYPLRTTTADRLPTSVARSSLSITPSPEGIEEPGARNLKAERGNMHLNLSLNSTMSESDKSRQVKAQSPNSGKVTLRSLSKSDSWKAQKTEEVPPSQPTPVHSAVAPWSSQAPPPAPAVPRTTISKTPEAPAVMLQRQTETRSKGTSESRLNFFKSLQVNSGDSNDSSAGDVASRSNEDISPGTVSVDETSSSGESLSLQLHSNSNTPSSTDDSPSSPMMSDDAPALRNACHPALPSESPRIGAIDRDHLTASFYDVVVDSGIIPFDDSSEVDDEDLRVMKVWGWTPDAYDNVECITLGEVANFQAVFRSYVAQKLQSDFLVNGSLGAQRLFRRHHQYMSNMAVNGGRPVTDSSEESASSSSSSDEERK